MYRGSEVVSSWLAVSTSPSLSLFSLSILRWLSGCCLCWSQTHRLSGPPTPALACPTSSFRKAQNRHSLSRVSDGVTCGPLPSKGPRLLLAPVVSPPQQGPLGRSASLCPVCKSSPPTQTPQVLLSPKCHSMSSPEAHLPGRTQARVALKAPCKAELGLIGWKGLGGGWGLGVGGWAHPTLGSGVAPEQGGPASLPLMVSDRTPERNHASASSTTALMAL